MIYNPSVPKFEFSNKTSVMSIDSHNMLVSVVENAKKSIQNQELFDCAILLEYPLYTEVLKVASENNITYEGTSYLSTDLGLVYHFLGNGINAYMLIPSMSNGQLDMFTGSYYQGLTVGQSTVNDAIAIFGNPDYAEVCVMHDRFTVGYHKNNMSITIISQTTSPTDSINSISIRY